MLGSEQQEFVSIAVSTTEPRVVNLLSSQDFYKSSLIEPNLIFTRGIFCLFCPSFTARHQLYGKFVEFYFSTIASEATQAASEAQRPPLMRPRTQKMLLKARMSLNNDAFDELFSQELTRF